MKIKDVLTAFILFFFLISFAIVTKNWVAILQGQSQDSLFTVIILTGIVVFFLAAMIIAPLGIIRQDESETET